MTVDAVSIDVSCGYLPGDVSTSLSQSLGSDGLVLWDIKMKIGTHIFAWNTPTMSKMTYQSISVATVCTMAD